jgi:hypothetical protein
MLKEVVECLLIQVRSKLYPDMATGHTRPATIRTLP